MTHLIVDGKDTLTKEELGHSTSVSTIAVSAVL
jgi:hypothetical protein